MERFDYHEAFSRNIGLVSETEQERLRRTCIGIAGLGGVGGSHLIAASRLGVGAFHLADLDCFELANFNRQLGATVRSLGKPKVDTLAGMARDIQPDVRLNCFPEGVHAGNLDSFLDGVDIVLDGLEFFAIDTRRMLYAACRRRGVPVIQAGPLGYGAALYVFLPDGISFDEHFGIDDAMTRVEMLMAHALGHFPGMPGDVDPSRIDFERQRGPALASACFLCSGLVAMEVVKLVCRRGRVTAAPHGLHIDPYRGRLSRLKRRPSLTRSLRGRLLRWFIFRRYPALRTLFQQELAERRHGASTESVKPEVAMASLPE